MTPIARALAFVTIFAAPIFANAADALENGFRNPPPPANAQTWWHWLDGNVTKSGITADLEAMQRAGIHEAQIFNVGQGFPEGGVIFMSDEFLELFKHAASEAKRLGMELSMHNGAGWSSSGGPWITPEHGMQKIVFSEMKVAGGKRTQGKLPDPPRNLEYYRDIAVLAFPTPADGARIDDLENKTLSGGGFPNAMTPAEKMIPAGAGIPLAKIVDLTKNLNASGVLTWDVPAGDWTILRVGHTAQGRKNHPAVPSGHGLECDKLSRAAFKLHWDNAVEPVLKKLGPLAGQALTNCLIDSYEVGCGNWTKDFDKEFKKRHRYDMQKFLPTIAGYYVESGEVSERFLWDFRNTLSDLMIENYYQYFVELCHKNNLRASTEPYGGPVDDLRAGANFDVPMGEFWVNSPGYKHSGKLAASIAHLQGTAPVGAEAFTADNNESRFLNHPSRLKPLGDLAWTWGINQFIFHTYTHQPWSGAIVPGMTFHMYGSEISRNNTWWEQAHAWMSYIARSQFLLQQGRTIADVLYFSGESAPNENLAKDSLREAGYDFDHISTNYLYKLTVKNGTLRTPAGGIYQMLVLPDTTWMTPQLAKHLNKLADDGAIIIGPQPKKSPSLENYPTADADVSSLAKDWSEKISTDSIPENVLAGRGILPDFRPVKNDTDLAYTHRATNDTDIYFITNQQTQQRTVECAFRVTGKTPEFYDAYSGKITPVPVFREENGRTILPITFEQNGAIFVVFKNTKPQTEPLAKVEFITEKRKLEPLPNLEIRHANYGVGGIWDVTEKVRAKIANNRLDIRADANFAGGDPAFMVVKELRVEYEFNGKHAIASVNENAHLQLPPGNDTGELKIIRAAYGKFPTGIGIPTRIGEKNVREKIIAEIARGNLLITVNDALVNSDTDATDPLNTLSIEYMTDGEMRKEKIPAGGILKVIKPEPEPKLIVENGGVIFVSPFAGSVKATNNSGAILTAKIENVPANIALDGAWSVSFQKNRGAPENAVFEKLIPLNTHSNAGIRHFSGTATYKKNFELPKNYIANDTALELDLGGVCVIADVLVNGKNLGTFWQAPFRIPLDDAARTGKNELEVRVTNLWVNRLIADARLPDDVEWGDYIIRRWPDWLKNGTARPSQRITFATWKHWGPDDPLLPSGLIGPVQIRPYKKSPLK